MELVYKPSEDLTVVDTTALCDFEVTEAEELLVFQCPITQVCFKNQSFFLFFFLLELNLIKDAY